LLCRELDRES